MSDVAGRNCPLRYRYAPQALSGAAEQFTDTVYIIGGLYGNIEALQTVLAMKQAERLRGVQVALIFNGDHNWFNVDSPTFTWINDEVLSHRAIQGNVEAELHEASDAGCGCAYPDYVDDATVQRSNAIMTQLQQRAAEFPRLRNELRLLPMHLTIELGGIRIAVVHGDAESLAGWAFAAERLSNNDRDPQAQQRIEHYFSSADVDIFASSHTCLPVLQEWNIDERKRLVVNNGSAGMPNFLGRRFGILTRISERLSPPNDSLYGARIGAVRVDAIPVRYDHRAWLRRFTTQWPEGSAAHLSYYGRMIDGPRYSPSQAFRVSTR